MTEDLPVATAATEPPEAPTKRRPAASETRVNWLVSFADLVTLLLTFLVLLISITTLDPQNDLVSPQSEVIQEEEEIKLANGVLLYSNWGMLAPVVELVENIHQLPDNVMLDQNEIKQAVFQLDPLKTPDYEQLQAATEDGLNIFKDSRGLVVQWDRSLIFSEGSSAMHEENQLLLQKLAVFLNSLKLPLSVEGHTDPMSELEGGQGPASYELSLKRAKVVMAYLVSLGVDEKRFRLGAHGGSQPRTQDPEQAWENSRLEIVIYKPEATSILGR